MKGPRMKTSSIRAPFLFVSHSRIRFLGATSVLGGSLLWTALAAAQNGQTAPAPTATGGQIVIPAQPPTVSTSQIVVTPFAPTPPGQPLGGGNVTSSSSMPKVGNESDTFDLLKGSGTNGSTGPKTAHGDPNGAAFLDSSPRVGTRVAVGGTNTTATTHRVQKGDTLWRICDMYFQNPYQWPRLWSLNPQIQNPHWIEPGDIVKLRGENGEGLSIATTSGKDVKNFVDQRRKVSKDTIFLHDVGFVDDSNEDDWGHINGSATDKMFLAPFDAIYVKVQNGHEPKPGQELAIFRPIKTVPGGKLVQIQGGLRVEQFNAEEKTARAIITDETDTIERGASFGPVQRKLNIVAPKVNQVETEATVLASIHPHEFYGQDQVVFIDKGTKDGLVPGNRLLIRRQGDAWRDSLPTAYSATRIALESDSPAQVEHVPTPDNRKSLPKEVIGELRVITLRDHSATCVVTTSTQEIELGDKAIAKRGY